jgi:hypothetical protein
MLSHVGKAFNRNGILFLGPTYKENVGYESYKIFQRNGYPKGYTCNRLNGGWEDNNEAMDYDQTDLDQIQTHLEGMFGVE